MKKLKFCLSLIVLTVFIFSCKKDKNNTTTLTPGTGPAYPNYSQLKVGNYWVYQQYDVDSLGNATPKSNIDSCYVEKDTIINSAIYFKMFRPYLYPSEYLYLRDSLHYVVDAGGKIVFSSQDFATVFEDYYITAGPNDTVAHSIVKMEDPNVLVNVQAGYFTTCDYRLTYNMYPGWSGNGNPRMMHTRYGRNTGIVIETLPVYAANPNYIERRLIRYHLN